jgi:hypothetical protein
LSSSLEVNKSDKETPSAFAIRSNVVTEGSVLPFSIRLYIAASMSTVEITSLAVKPLASLICFYLLAISIPKNGSLNYLYYLIFSSFLNDNGQGFHFWFFGLKLSFKNEGPAAGILY